MTDAAGGASAAVSSFFFWQPSVTNAHSSARAKQTPIFCLRTGPHQARHADPRAPIGKKLLSSNKMSKTSLFSVFPGDDRYSLSFAQRKTIFQPASIIF